jgi:hypothetical protein
MNNALGKIWFIVRVVGSVAWLWMGVTAWGFVDGPEINGLNIGIACVCVALFLWSEPSNKETRP